MTHRLSVFSRGGGFFQEYQGFSRTFIGKKVILLEETSPKGVFFYLRYQAKDFSGQYGEPQIDFLTRLFTFWKKHILNRRDFVLIYIDYHLHLSCEKKHDSCRQKQKDIGCGRTQKKLTQHINYWGTDWYTHQAELHLWPVRWSRTANDADFLSRSHDCQTPAPIRLFACLAFRRKHKPDMPKGTNWHIRHESKHFLSSRLKALSGCRPWSWKNVQGVGHIIGEPWLFSRLNDAPERWLRHTSHHHSYYWPSFMVGSIN